MDKLDIHQAAAQAGVSVSSVHIYLSKGIIPRRKLPPVGRGARKLYFEPADIEAIKAARVWGRKQENTEEERTRKPRAPKNNISIKDWDLLANHPRLLAVARRHYPWLSGTTRFRFERQGNFTICLLAIRDSLYSGVSMCNHDCDEYDPSIGEPLALSRAVQAACEDK